MSAVERAIAAILRREGAALTEHPADRGGLTKFGITFETFRRWREGTATREELARLEAAEAGAIYRRFYIEEPGFAVIADGFLLDLAVDAAVLHGPGTAVRWLQAAVGVEADGLIGPVTRAALTALDERGARVAAKRLLARRYRALAEIVARDPGQAVFLAGWINRLNHFLLEIDT